MRDGLSGVPVSGSPFMPGVECADCHVYRYEPTNITGHSFTPKAEACVVCHQVTPPIYSNETAQVRINEWNTNTWTRALEVQETLVLARSTIDNALQYGFSTSTIDAANDLYEEAEYSLTYVVADGSGGVHNPSFASDLLNFSESKSDEIMSLLSPGSVTGRAVDESGSPVEGVAVYIEGRLRAISRDNGTFTFSYAPGTYTIELRLAGERVGSVDAVEVVKGQVTDLGDITISEGALFVILMIVIVVIFFFVIILTYLLTRRQKEIPKEPGKEEFEQEEDEV